MWAVGRGGNIVHRDRHHTPVGTNEGVHLPEGTIIFDEVTGSGITTIDACGPGSPPTGFRLGAPPMWFCLETTATFTGMAEVCFDYNEDDFSQPEKNFRLFHFKPNGDGVDITTSLDTENNIICGMTDSFSEFAILEEKPQAELEGPDIDGQFGGCVTVYGESNRLALLLLPLLIAGLFQRRSRQ